MSMAITPYEDSTSSKKEQVAEMFNRISMRYDFLNHFLSMRIDVAWRRKAIQRLAEFQPKNILDVATGTGDLAIAALKLNPKSIVGIDISEGMLEIGRNKLRKKKIENIELISGDSENLHFGDASFDAVTVGFGVRNFENLDKGLAEIYRVLQEGGVVVVLEFSKAKKFPMKQLYFLQSNYIVPTLGRLIAKEKRAYSYLTDSIEAFPESNNFLAILERTGFTNTAMYPLSGGIATIYIGIK